MYIGTIYPYEIPTEKSNNMENNIAIQLFENTQVRIVWNEQEEQFYFSVVDVIGVLTGSASPRNYWKVLKSRLKKEGNETVTNCNQLKLQAEDGKKRLTDVANMEQLLRIIQSVPSPKAEPLKQWLAEIGSKRIDQMIDPELTFQMAVEDYRRQGYSDEWINERMKSIMTRKSLTDEWKRVGITQEKDYALLTNILTKAWSGMTTREYKSFKGLTKQNLRDNMTGVEVALNTLAEASSRELSRQRNPQTFRQSKTIAQDGGGVAKVARQQLEKKLGKSVLSPLNARQIQQIENTPVEDAKIITDGKEQSDK